MDGGGVKERADAVSTLDDRRYSTVRLRSLQYVSPARAVPHEKPCVRSTFPRSRLRGRCCLGLHASFEGHARGMLNLKNANVTQGLTT